MSSFVHQFWASTIDGFTIGSIYALVALGYTLVYGVLQLINFAHSEIFMVGTFASLATIQAFGLTSPATGVLLVAVILCAGLAGAAASSATAVTVEMVAYRPLRRRTTSRLAALITAIGASLTLQEIFALSITRDTVPLHQRVMSKTNLFNVGSGTVRADKVLVFAAAVLMMIVLDRFVNGTRLGRSIRATAQDAESATLMGVNINRVVTLTFLVGGAMAGIAGALYILYYEQTNYFIGFVLGIKAFTAAVLGGIGNLRGALLGGFTIGLIENYGASFSFVGAEWKDVISFTVLVLVLLFRPTGLLGESLAKSRA